MPWTPDWTTRAACRDEAPDKLFVQGAAQNRAKTVCLGCPVRTECLADALDNRVEYGVWGGMTERERRALLRRRPEVRSWRQFLEAAKEKYERSGEEVDPRFDAATQAAIPRQRSEAGSFGRA
jgi:WhiB family transcriptional regulator, redox-sensing transcriptional regulator